MLKLLLGLANITLGIVLGARDLLEVGLGGNGLVLATAIGVATHGGLAGDLGGFLLVGGTNQVTDVLTFHLHGVFSVRVGASQHLYDIVTTDGSR